MESSQTQSFIKLHCGGENIPWNISFISITAGLSRTKIKKCSSQRSSAESWWRSRAKSSRMIFTRMTLKISSTTTISQSTPTWVCRKNRWSAPYLINKFHAFVCRELSLHSRSARRWFPWRLKRTALETIWTRKAPTLLTAKWWARWKASTDTKAKRRKRLAVKITISVCSTKFWEGFR